MSEEYSPTACFDFDGVIHPYPKGWLGIDIIEDVPPVSGFIETVENYLANGINVAIYSSRSREHKGKVAIIKYAKKYFPDLIPKVRFPEHKPPAHVYIDDRGFHFQGTFPSAEFIKTFKPWNKKKAEKDAELAKCREEFGDILELSHYTDEEAQRLGWPRHLRALTQRLLRGELPFDDDFSYIVNCFVYDENRGRNLRGLVTAADRSIHEAWRLHREYEKNPTQYHRYWDIFAHLASAAGALDMYERANP